MKVLCENSNHERREIGVCNSKEEAYEIITRFLNQHNYRAYYYNVSMYEDYERVDVGSWSEFFYIYYND